jgi:hypothetical protein
MAAKRPTGAYPKSSKKSIAKARFKDSQKNGRVLSGEVITPGSTIRLGAKVLTAAQKAIVGRAVRENVLEKTAQRAGAKAKPMLRKVSDKDARAVSREMSKRPNNVGRARAVTKPDNTVGVGRSEARRMRELQPITKKQGTPVKPKDVLEARAKARAATVKKQLTPIRPRGVPAGGKSIAGPKTNPRTITVAKPSAATTRAKRVNPGDRKLDESRRQGMKDAIRDNRNTFQPLNKSPYQRELEQVREGKSSNISTKPTDRQMAEADRRVNEALKSNRKPDMPNSKKIGEAARKRPNLDVRKKQSLNAQAKRISALDKAKGLSRKQRLEKRAKAKTIATRIRREATGGK